MLYFGTNTVLNFTLTLAPSELPGGPCRWDKEKEKDMKMHIYGYFPFLEVALVATVTCDIKSSNLCTNVSSNNSPSHLYIILECVFVMHGSQAPLLLWYVNFDFERWPLPSQLHSTPCRHWTWGSDTLECVVNWKCCPRDLPQQKQVLINTNNTGWRPKCHTCSISSGHCHLEMSHLLHFLYFLPYETVSYNSVSY